jgi:hypothetical protein
MSCLPRTQARIDRIKARKTQIDAALLAFAEGIEEYRIGSVMERKSSAGSLFRERQLIDAQISRLEAIADGSSLYLAAHGMRI